MSNKKIGNQFENELCEILSAYGFWCHNMAQNAAGQPADVIAVRNGKAYLIDCKVCSTDRGFALSRMEENQDLSMDLWYECGNGQGWFAMKLPNEEIVMLPHVLLKAWRTVHSHISLATIMEMGKQIDEWVKRCR